MLYFATNLLRQCTECQVKTGVLKDQRHTLISTVTGYPFQKLSLDFVGPLPTSHNGNKYILTVKDTFSRWLEAFPVRAATAAVVVNKLEKEIFSRYGLCDQMHSDRGTQFLSDLVHDVAQTFGVRATATPAYNPKSNSVERSHRTLENAITALVGDRQSDWEKFLPHVLFAMRTAVCRSTGLAPYKTLFGRDASTQLDLIFGNPNADTSQYRSSADYALALQNRVQAAHKWARENMAVAVERQRRAYHHDKKTYDVEQAVWLFTPTRKVGQSSKFATYWTGPWTIVKKINDLTYQIRPHPSWLRKKNEVVSIDRLKTFHASELSNESATKPPQEDADLRMLGDEFCERIEIAHDHDQSPRTPPRRASNSPSSHIPTTGRGQTPNTAQTNIPYKNCSSTDVPDDTIERPDSNRQRTPDTTSNKDVAIPTTIATETTLALPPDRPDKYSITT